MEFVEGGSLQSRLEEAHRRPAGTSAEAIPGGAREIARLFAGVADALHFAHAAGVVHRDVKPANLLVDRESGGLRITDFGIAHDASFSRLTRTGAMLGTAHYMAPEQILAERAFAEPRSDIWSLGVTLCEALYLQMPFAADSEEAYLYAVLHREPSLPRAGATGVPRDLETILLKCLERDPARRYDDAGALRDDLLAFAQGRPIAARRVGWPGRVVRRLERNRRAVILVAVVGLVLIAGALVVQRVGRTRGERGRLLEILKRSAETGTFPESTGGDWSRLHGVMDRELERAPRGEIAKAAMRAGLVLSADLPRFGLLGSAPLLNCGIETRADLSRSSVYGLDVEASCDGGPWKRLGGCVVSAGRSSGFGFSLARVIPPATGSAEHRIELRSRVRVLAEKRMLRKGALDISGAPEIGALAPGPWAAPDDEYRLSLGSHVLQLFSTYPADFPRPIRTRDLGVPLDSLLRGVGVRLFCVRPAAEGDSVLHVRIPRGSPDVRVAIPSRARRTEPLLIGMSLEAIVSHSLPPVSARVAVQLIDRTIVGGTFRLVLALRDSASMLFLAMPERDRPENTGLTTTPGARGDTALVTREWAQAPLQLPGSVADVAKLQGARIRFVPDRTLALSTGRVSEFLADTLEMVSPVEVLYLPAH
jgi:hypothetical protein